ERRVIGVTRLVEEAPRILVGKAVEQARLAKEGFAAAFRNLTQQPLEILLRLLVHRQCMHRVFEGNGAEILQSAPDFDAQISRLRRELMDEQKPAMCERRLRSGVHEKSVSIGRSCRNTCIISTFRVILLT